MILLIFPFFLLIASIDSMDAQEEQSTGISKLNDQEKSALQKWIEKYYTPRSSTKKKKTSPTLQENLSNGRYVRLSNNSTWEIHPNDRSITQGWITPVEIIISQSGDPQYPYMLTNSLTGSSVRAQQTLALPPSPPPSLSPAKTPKTL